MIITITRIRLETLVFESETIPEELDVLSFEEGTKRLIYHTVTEE